MGRLVADPVRRLHTRHRRTDRGLPTRWRWLVVRLERADVSANEWASIVAVATAMVPLAAIVAVVGRPAAGAIVALAAPVVPFAVLARWRARRDLRLVDVLPATLDQLARSLRAGRTPRQAIERVAEHGPRVVGVRLQRVADALRLGAGPDRALSALCSPSGPRAIARVAVVLRLALHDGQGAADAIEGLATSLRTDHRLGARVQVLTAQARLSVRTLTALPLLFAALGAIGGPAQTTALLTTDVGRLCAVVGGTLLASGHAWMLTLVRRIDR